MLPYVSFDFVMISQSIKDARALVVEVKSGRLKPL